MPWKRVAVAVLLVFGAANMTAGMAFGRGMSGGAHLGGGFAGHGFAIGHGFAGHRFAISRGFAGHRFAIRHRFFIHPFRKNIGSGGLWLSFPVPTEQYGGTDAATYPGTAGFAPELIPVPVCHRSEEIVRVPAEAGGTRQIKVTNCPYGL